MLPSVIKTFTGKFLDLANPKPDQIDIEDIAQALATERRWANQSRRFMSVAEHSVIIAKHSFNGYAALLHDATQAYIRDIPTQLKALIPDYKLIENRLYKAIAIHFNAPLEIPSDIKEIENFLIKKEYAYLCHRPGETGYQDHSEIFNCWPSPVAYKNYMERFTKLKQAHVPVNRELSV